MGILGTTDIMSAFDVILLVFGFYTIYSAVMMKKKQVPGKWLIPEQEMGKCRDAKGFIEAIYKKTIAFGILAVVYGIVSVINRFLLSSWILEMACIVIFLACIVWFMVLLNKAKKQFFY